MNYRDCFFYFINKYHIQTGRDYFYLKSRLGLELLKLKRLNLNSVDFMRFVDWLFMKKKLSSINFLPAQLNDYYSSQEYQKDLEVESLLLHYKLMKIRKVIVGQCKVCNGVGRINDNYCECMEKFILIRKKMRGIK